MDKKIDATLMPNQEQYEYILTQINSDLNSISIGGDGKKEDTTEAKIKVQNVEKMECDSFEELRNQLNRNAQSIAELNDQVPQVFEYEDKDDDKMEDLDEIDDNDAAMDVEIPDDIQQLGKEITNLVELYKNRDIAAKILEGPTAAMMQDAKYKEISGLLDQFSITEMDMINDVIEEKLREVSAKLQEQFEICAARITGDDEEEEEEE